MSRWRISPIPSAQAYAQLLQTQTRSGIALKLGISSDGLRNPLIVIRKHARQRIQQTPGQCRPLPFRKLHRLLLELTETLHNPI